MSHLANEAIDIEDSMMRMKIEQINYYEYDNHSITSTSSLTEDASEEEEQENTATVFIETNHQHAGRTTPWQKPDEDDEIRLNTVAMM